MRGDSLRDFYAKTLAVLGLGLLAGAGAVVDYWPVGSALPSVKAVRLPAPDVPMLAQNFDRRIPAPVNERRVFARGTIHAKNVGTARFLPAAPAGAASAPIQAAVNPQPIPDFALPVGSANVESLLIADPVPPPVEYATATPQSSATQAPGFIGGALKKTKDSIVKTGAVTGSAIADTFKGVFGAFKKVSPF